MFVKPHYTSSVNQSFIDQGALSGECLMYICIKYKHYRSILKRVILIFEKCTTVQLYKTQVCSVLAFSISSKSCLILQLLLMQLLMLMAMFLVDRFDWRGQQHLLSVEVGPFLKYTYNLCIHIIDMANEKKSALWKHTAELTSTYQTNILTDRQLSVVRFAA